MTEQHIRKLGISRPGIFQQLVGILHCSKPSAVKIPSDSAAVYRLPMAHMILCNHKKSQRIQVFCNVLIGLTQQPPQK